MNNTNKPVTIYYGKENKAIRIAKVLNLIKMGFYVTRHNTPEGHRLGHYQLRQKVFTMTKSNKHWDMLKMKVKSDVALFCKIERAIAINKPHENKSITLSFEQYEIIRRL